MTVYLLCQDFGHGFKAISAYYTQEKADRARQRRVSAYATEIATIYKWLPEAAQQRAERAYMIETVELDTAA